ncbi:MAG: hypothetical protein EP308_10870 [Burkholderiales bacterium]|nr:MAG: hypothetical protein EP308_10870 [Burkholderiales bacterium]
MNQNHLDTLIRAHRHATARHQASLDRREAMDDFWRGANAVWGRVQLDMGARLSRSARRLQSRLDRRVARC